MVIARLFVLLLAVTCASANPSVEAEPATTGSVDLAVIAPIQRALAIDADFHEARFNLARVLARAGQRADAAREAQELLTRLPANAPQRAEVQRLIDALR